MYESTLVLDRATSRKLKDLGFPQKGLVFYYNIWQDEKTKEERSVIISPFPEERPYLYDEEFHGRKVNLLAAPTDAELDQILPHRIDIPYGHVYLQMTGMFSNGEREFHRIYYGNLCSIEASNLRQAKAEMIITLVEKGLLKLNPEVEFNAELRTNES